MTAEARAQKITTGRATNQAGNSERAARARWLLITVAIGTTLAPLNSTMIAVALPDIQLAFGVSVTATAWLVTLYLAAMAVGQPIGGRLGDLYGRRRVYLAGLIWFAIASAGCAFAPNLWLLILFRTQQALAGALTFPNGAALVREHIPRGRRGSAFGLIGMAASTAAAAGPPMGGLLVHQFGWAAIFWANVPVVLIATLLGLRSLPVETQQRPVEARERFDVAGSLTFAAALALLIAVPTMIRLDLPIPAIACAAGGIVLGIVFVMRELGVSAPVVDMRLFGRTQFAAACASVGLTNLVMYTTLLALPLYLERVRGHDSRVTGLTLAALSALSALTGPLGGRWTDIRGRVVPAVAGSLSLLAGTLALALTVSGERIWPLILALAAMGIGLGISGASVQAAAVESVPGERAGSASGVYSTSRYLGSVIGSTALAIAFVSKPEFGASGRFVWLFAALVLVAAFSVVVNARVGSE